MWFKYISMQSIPPANCILFKVKAANSFALKEYMQDKEQVRRQNLSMVESWRQSGLSQKQYCLQNKIAYHVFHYWYKRYRDRQSTNQSNPKAFIPVTIDTVSSTAYVELQFPNGKKILFHQPVSIDYLKAMIG